ncbi:hypothetical protein ABIA32_000333 [Streptacidiphilus sp. MAP12-20]|uniref:hypothetical protein n=1 Tax=Streptacidiphilus sp. MAP12-20 TaxID=3156299 RepID=UPI003516DE15
MDPRARRRAATAVAVLLTAVVTLGTSLLPSSAHAASRSRPTVSHSLAWSASAHVQDLQDVQDLQNARDHDADASVSP